MRKQVWLWGGPGSNAGTYIYQGERVLATNFPTAQRVPVTRSDQLGQGKSGVTQT